MHDEIVRGIEAKRVKNLIDSGTLAAKQVYRVIPLRTFNRRLAKGEALKVSESDAIARLLRVTEAARKTFGDADFAGKWLTLPNPVLKNLPNAVRTLVHGTSKPHSFILHTATISETGDAPGVAIGAAGVCERAQRQGQHRTGRALELARSRCGLWVVQSLALRSRIARANAASVAHEFTRISRRPNRGSR